MDTYSLDSTLFLPLSADPAGFNHFALAEWVLRADPTARQVVFLLSNGYHPDPTKADAATPAALRLELLKRQIAEIADPARSHLARLAQSAGEPLRIGPGCLSVCTLELEHARPVPTAESVAALRQGRSEPVRLVAGSDLAERMRNPGIFSDEDLRYLASACRYCVFEREGDASAALEALQTERGVSLDAVAIPRAQLPEWLAPFLELASTRVREAAEAGDPLGAMVTESARERILASGAYGTPPRPIRLVDAQGRELGTRTGLALRLEALREALREAAGPIAARLEAAAAQGRAHRLAIAECTVGGLLTWAFASRSGASRFLAQSRFVYDREAKQSLLGGERPAASAVSAELVAALAMGMREQARADFALAESGMAGPPDGQRRSLKSGRCWLGLASAAGCDTLQLRLNPFLTRQEHQLRFAILALEWLEEKLRSETAGGPP